MVTYKLFLPFACMTDIERSHFSVAIVSYVSSLFALLAHYVVFFFGRSSASLFVMMIGFCLDPTSCTLSSSTVIEFHLDPGTSSTAVQYESTGLLVLDDGSRANAVSGNMCREGTVVGGLILLLSEGVQGGDGERLSR